MISLDELKIFLKLTLVKGCRFSANDYVLGINPHFDPVKDFQIAVPFQFDEDSVKEIAMFLYKETGQLFAGMADRDIVTRLTIVKFTRIDEINSSGK